MSFPYSTCQSPYFMLRPLFLMLIPNDLYPFFAVTEISVAWTPIKSRKNLNHISIKSLKICREWWLKFQQNGASFFRLQNIGRDEARQVGAQADVPRDGEDWSMNGFYGIMEYMSEYHTICIQNQRIIESIVNTSMIHGSYDYFKSMLIYIYIFNDIYNHIYIYQHVDPLWISKMELPHHIMYIYISR